MRSTVPCICFGIAPSNTREPKPVRSGVQAIDGPPHSVQRRCRSLPRVHHVIETVPVSIESAPCLAALVASSCTAIAKGWEATAERVIGGPSNVARPSTNGATTLLSTAHRPEERVRAQAANDSIVFGTVACTAFLSGAVHNHAGWAVLNLATLPPIALALGLIAWQWHRGTRQAVA